MPLGRVVRLLDEDSPSSNYLERGYKGNGLGANAWVTPVSHDWGKEPIVIVIRSRHARTHASNFPPPLQSTVELFLSLQLPSALEYLYIGKQYATVIRPAVRQLNGDDVLVLKSHFSLNYPSLKEAHFYAVNFIMKYEKGNVSNSS